MHFSSRDDDGMIRMSGMDDGMPGRGKLTPAMEQYHAIKEKYPDTVVLFHMGDFYETFGSDAELVSRELDIVLTSRSKDRDGNRIPLAGVPCHAVEGYIARLVGKGYRVAVCDQTEDPKIAKGLVKRDVVRVITPGTVIDSAMLRSSSALYLMAVAPAGRDGQMGVAFLDISTGEFFALVCSHESGDLLSEVAKYQPGECILPPSLSGRIGPGLSERGVVVTLVSEESFSPQRAQEALMTHFRVDSLDGFGAASGPDAVLAAGAALRYAKETQKTDLDHITGFSIRYRAGSLILDAITLRNLELFQNVRGEPVHGTLLGTIDRTKTPMGGRLLRAYLTAPLTDRPEIDRRLDSVEYFFHDTMVREQLRELLPGCADLERIAGRISYGNAGPRDLIALKESLLVIPRIRKILPPAGEKPLPGIVCRSMDELHEMPGLIDLISRAIVDDPPAGIRAGGMIREGYDPELDRIRALSTSGRQWMTGLQQTEREKTGIKSLKIGFNSVFGYYIEVTKANLPLIPDHYIRRQTTSTGERYTIPELKEMEARIATADDSLLAREGELYAGLIDILRGSIPELQAIAHGVSLLDVFTGLADLAKKHRYVRPVLDDTTGVLVREGRHPVVEQGVPGGYVPNDLQMDGTKEQILIITGANMAGKSTYMRSAALLVILAQMGSFVPAGYARFGIVDRVFTRVGAFDDLARGQSTFMVEMLELANILNNVTNRSLVILDEIGRGTSTLDGSCIARAVLEYLHGKGVSGPRTLFATHFHELVSVEGDLPRVKNYHFAVKDTGDSVVFLRKIIPGATDKSYGVHVAQRAGVPAKVIDRAYALLKESAARETLPAGKKPRYTQMLLVDAPEVMDNLVIQDLRHLALDGMTPLDALLKLYELQRRINDEAEQCPR
jgi:DNA mismatch repair protein MutS